MNGDKWRDIMNSVKLIGRIATEIEFKKLADEKTVANFVLAVDRGYSKEKKLEEKEKGNSTADFINIIVWGKMAEVLYKHSAKGKLIGVSGRFQSGNYENKEGIKVYTIDIVANNIDILEWNNDSNKDKD